MGGSRVQYSGKEIFQRLPTLLPAVPSEWNVSEQAQLETIILMGLLGNILLPSKPHHDVCVTHFLLFTGKKSVKVNQVFFEYFNLRLPWW